MPNQKISDFDEDTNPASNDMLVTVDVSDTAQSPEGSTKRTSPANLTKALSVMVGDSGSGGTKGLVPAPGAGDAAAGKFLKADGTFAVPSGTGAPTDATYITQTPSGGLSNEQAMSALATGLVKNTTATGVQSIADVNDISAPVFAADAGANDTYTATLSPAPAAYVTGAHYRFKANTANTGACTINFNSLGAKTIKKAEGGITTDLADNDIRAGQWVDLVYDGTNMQMQSNLGNAASGGGATINATDGRIPYRSSSTAFSDSQLLRHSLYHTAFQDSTFTSSNNRIWDWYLTSNDNSASPSSYQRIRLQNNTSGWTFTTQNATVGGMYLKIGTESADRLYLRTGGSDRWFIGESNGHIHCNSDGGSDVGTGSGFRPGNVFVTNSVSIAGTALTTGGSSIVDMTGVSGVHSTFRFQTLRAIKYVTLVQTLSIGAGAYSWNLLSGSLIRQTLTANMTQVPTISNAVTDQILDVELIQDGTGSRTFMWPSNFKFPGGTAPTLSTTASTRDIFKFRYDGTNWYEVSRSMDVR
jgi:hypothetical protein